MRVRCISLARGDNGRRPKVDHYVHMVGFLGHARKLDDAFNIITTMPAQPDAVMFGVFHGDYKIHCNVELGEWSIEKLFYLEPDNVGYYI